jgi:hypothetical protein
MREIAIMAVAVITVVMAVQPASAKADERCAGPLEKYNPPSGMVANQSVAVAIARTYLSALYGADHIKRELPLIAELRRDVWHVEGSFKNRGAPRMKGGVAIIEICKSNGRVLSVIHEK